MRARPPNLLQVLFDEGPQNRLLRDVVDRALGVLDREHPGGLVEAEHVAVLVPAALADHAARGEAEALNFAHGFLVHDVFAASLPQGLIHLVDERSWAYPRRNSLVQPGIGVAHGNFHATLFLQAVVAVEQGIARVGLGGLLELIVQEIFLVRQGLVAEFGLGRRGLLGVGRGAGEKSKRT